MLELVGGLVLDNLDLLGLGLVAPGSLRVGWLTVSPRVALVALLLLVLLLMAPRILLVLLLMTPRIATLLGVVRVLMLVLVNVRVGSSVRGAATLVG